MSALDILALTAAVLVGLGFYGLLAMRHLLRRVLSFNLVGSGLFLWFGAAGARGGGAPGVDPIPQALIITGIVVALAASALAVVLVVAHARLSGPTLPEEAPRADEAGSDTDA